MLSVQIEGSGLRSSVSVVALALSFPMCFWDACLQEHKSSIVDLQGTPSFDRGSREMDVIAERYRHV
jgi:hypothetical protein